MSARRSVVCLMVLAVAFAALMCPLAASADTQAYRIQTIDLPRTGPYAGATLPWSCGSVRINASGLMSVGFCDENGQAHAALVENGRWTLIDFPGAVQTNVSSPNARGEVMLSHDDVGDAVSWHVAAYQRGRYTPLPDLSDVTWPTVLGLSDRGVFCGTGMDSAGQVIGFLGAGAEHALFSFSADPCTRTFAYGINNQGMVIGTYCGWDYGWAKGRNSFLYDSRTGLGAPIAVPEAAIPGAGVFQGGAINNQGDFAVPACWDGGFGAIVSRGGQYVTIPASGDIACIVPGAINDRGQVSGVYTDGTGTHGFIATPTRGK